MPPLSDFDNFDAQAALLPAAICRQSRERCLQSQGKARPITTPRRCRAWSRTRRFSCRNRHRSSRKRRREARQSVHGNKVGDAVAIDIARSHGGAALVAGCCTVKLEAVAAVEGGKAHGRSPAAGLAEDDVARTGVGARPGAATGTPMMISAMPSPLMSPVATLDPLLSPAAMPSMRKPFVPLMRLGAGLIETWSMKAVLSPPWGSVPMKAMVREPADAVNG